MTERYRDASDPSVFAEAKRLGSFSEQGGTTDAFIQFGHPSVHGRFNAALYRKTGAQKYPGHSHY